MMFEIFHLVSLNLIFIPNKKNYLALPALNFQFGTDAMMLLALRDVAVAHGAMYIPTPRNAMDRALPEFEGGKSPIEACTW